MESSEDTNVTTPRNVFPHPTLAEYYGNLTPFVVVSMFLATLLLLLNFSIFSTTTARLRRQVRRNWLAPTVFIGAMYPVLSAAAFVTILAPKAWLVCHTVMHLCFPAAAVVFQGLCFRYASSAESLVKDAGVEGAAVRVDTPPCCCCCPCLPALPPSPSYLRLLRYVVRQLVVVQSGIMLVLNVIYFWEPELYANVMVYFIPFIIGSILVGVWGLNITVRMVGRLHPEYGLMKKMFCVQLIILLGKLQYLILDNQLSNVRLGRGDVSPTKHIIYKQTLINLLIMMEMVLVSLLFQNAYTIPVEVEHEQTEL